MTIQLAPEPEQYIAERVNSGRYLSASEAISEGVRLLQEQESEADRKLEALRQEIDIGLAQSERGELVDGPEFMAELLRRHDERVKLN